ncbi:MAG: PepSY domain-containing protein [Acidimicrobiales bacterium]
MQRRTMWLTGSALAIALIGGGTGVAVAATSGGDDEPLTGSTLERAVAAALEETGGGTVVETEVGDDGAAYGVEVRLADGSQVEVNLDRDFNVIGHEADDDGPNDDGSNDDDVNGNDD